MQILKRTTSKPILPSSESELTYEIGHDPTGKSFHIRLTGNTGGGLFSHEWIAIDAVLDSIQAIPDGETFKAVIFRPLYKSRSANNAGFLAACLRNEGLIVTPEKSVYGHLPGDGKAFLAAMRKLVAGKTSLEDTFGKALAAKEAERQKRLEALKRKKA